MTEAGTVVLIHGLWMCGLEMSLLHRRLRRQGFETRRFTYPTVKQGLAENAGALHAFLEKAGNPPPHLIGHSLGGLVILRMLCDCPTIPSGRIILLGAPLSGSALACWLGRWRLGRLLLGKSLHALQGIDCAPACTGRDIGMIAGTLNLGIARWAGIAAPCDGTVAVTETCGSGLNQPLLLPVSHMGLVVSRAVAVEVGYFLHHGRFAHSPEFLDMCN